MRRIRPRAVHLAIVASLALSARGARAEDFEFEVPVQISKMDTAFTQGRVHCQVRGVARDPSGLATGGNALVASGDTTFALVNGGYNGTVSVKFNAGRPQHEPADGRTWNCGLSFLSAGGAVDACVADAMTGIATGKFPAILNLDPKSVKTCAQGTITGPGTKK